MGKITGYERREQIPEKVLLLYEAVLDFVSKGEDIQKLTVSDITGRAGIGKGTAYDYFSSKEEIIVCALMYSMLGMVEKVGLRLVECKGFKEQVEGLFSIIEDNIMERSCFVRFVNLMTSTNIYSQALNQISDDATRVDEIPMQLLKQMLADGIKRGEVRSDLPLDYLTYELVATLLTYITMLSGNNQLTMTAEEMKPFVLKSIWNEFCA